MPIEMITDENFMEAAKQEGVEIEYREAFDPADHIDPGCWQSVEFYIHKESKPECWIVDGEECEDIDQVIRDLAIITGLDTE